jgi:hypothetical protein
MPKSQQFDLSILRHSGIWGAADEAMLNKYINTKIYNARQSWVQSQQPPIWLNLRGGEWISFELYAKLKIQEEKNGGGPTAKRYRFNSAMVSHV